MKEKISNLSAKSQLNDGMQELIFKEGDQLTNDSGYKTTDVDGNLGWRNENSILIEFSGMSAFSAISEYQEDSKKSMIKITAKLPKDTVIEGQNLCTIERVVIRRSEDDYPKDELSGDFVANITKDQEIVDEDVIAGTTYYYAAFPYITIYNKNVTNQVKVVAESVPAKDYYIFGYDLVKDVIDSDARVTYPSDVDNADYTPATMNFTSDEFDYGGWPSIPGERFMPRPCMLKYDCTVAEYLDPNDYTKRWTEDGVYHFRCSDIKIDDEYDCWCNYDKNDNEIDHFYTPIYFGSLVSSKLRSISGQNYDTNKTISEQISGATANGSGWYIEFLSDRLLIQDLLVMMAKSSDTQEKYGYGNAQGYDDSVYIRNKVDTNTKGLFWGKKPSDYFDVKVFGMENWWGNSNRRIAGWIYDRGIQKIKITWGIHDGSATTNFNLEGNNYISVGSLIKNPNSSASAWNTSYTIDFNYGRIVSFDYYNRGNLYEKESDIFIFGNSITEGQTNYAIVGSPGLGDSNYNYSGGIDFGAFGADISKQNSYYNKYCGAALSCKPIKQ